jgi:hypothetical protein
MGKLYLNYSGLADAITHLGSVRHNNRKNGDREIDLYGEERKQWERQQLGEMIKLSGMGFFSIIILIFRNRSRFCSISTNF